MGKKRLSVMQTMREDKIILSEITVEFFFCCFVCPVISYQYLVPSRNYIQIAYCSPL